MNIESPNGFFRNENKIEEDEKSEIKFVVSRSLKSTPCFGISLSNEKSDQETEIQEPLVPNFYVETHLTNTKSVNKLSLVNKSCYINEKKTCNCTKSHCLKLYCECFARGQACIGCSCSNCMNNIDFEEDRTRAIQQTLDRNPSAFHPKIGCVVKRHSKGCNCKRSSCLKNYCECFEAKIFCSDLCKCKGCRNCSDTARPKSAENLFYSQDSRTAINGFATYITPGLIEVVCSCMLSHLILSDSGIDQEAIILVEFAKFLEHVLKSINIQLKNDQLNYSCADPPSLIGTATIYQLNNKIAPHFTSTNFSDSVPNDTRTEILEERSGLLGRSIEYTVTDRTEFNSQMFPDNNSYYSSNIPGFSLPSHYDPIQPSFRSLLSTNEEADVLCTYENCEFPSSSELAIIPPSGYQFTTLPHPISTDFSDSAIQDSGTVIEPLPHDQSLLESVSADDYSSEANLAAAAISGEMNDSSNSASNNISDFYGCEPDYYSKYSPFCNPFDSIL